MLESAEANIQLYEGIYAYYSGPSYETPTEARAMRMLGADVVGMSTVPEAIVARHAGMNVVGISCITNMASGVIDKTINHNEVVANAIRLQEEFARLINLTLEICMRSI